MATSMRALWLAVAIGSALSLPLACSSSDGSTGNNNEAGKPSAAGQSNAGTGTQAGNGSGGSNSTAGTTSGGMSSAGTSAGTSTGTAGTTVSAGASSGGMSGGGASGGGAANGGGSSGGAPAATASPGCSMPAGQALGSWVEQPKLNVAGTDRQWWVWLPTGYDPLKPYPLIFNFHGCSSADNIVPMQKVAGDKAVLVRGTGISDGVCWDAGAGGNDVKFFDQMLADVVAKRCVDTSRVFTTGYSSGSWLVNTLDCERGDKLRGSGTVSGGTYGDKSKCKGKYARIFIHDQDDMTNKISDGDNMELPRLVTANKCMNATPVMEAPAPCARYQGCDAGYPVIWCQTMGKQHDRQDALAPGAFWGLFSSL
jgi:polyhydroxybutyrate depolymerase